MLRGITAIIPGRAYDVGPVSGPWSSGSPAAPSASCRAFSLSTSLGEMIITLPGNKDLTKELVLLKSHIAESGKPGSVRVGASCGFSKRLKTKILPHTPRALRGAGALRAGIALPQGA